MRIVKVVLGVEIICAMFLIGLLLGIGIMHNKNKELLNNKSIELDDTRERIEILTQENNKLETLLNNYTIQERKESK